MSKISKKIEQDLVRHEEYYDFIYCFKLLGFLRKYFFDILVKIYKVVHDNFLSFF